MSFAALAAWQALAFIAAAGAAAALVFRMKVRPPRVILSSLLVWRRVLDQAASLSWWERIRRMVSLALTVLIALALATAATRPSPTVDASSQPRVLIVLDSSWSMRARTADGATRWAHAVAAARALAQAPGTEQVAVATTAEGLIEGPTSDLALIATAIDRLEPSGGGDTAWPRLGGASVSTHLFTDGAATRPREPGVIVHSVFDAAPNVAITAFNARPATSSATKPSVYLEVSNFSSRAQDVRVTVTRDQAVLVDRRATYAAGEVTRDLLTLEPEGGARLRAHVSAPDDALAIDDDAVAWLPLAEPVRVTVVSDAPQVFSDLLRHDPHLRTTVVRPSDYAAEPADVFIFDRWVPPDAPARPTLYVAPPTASWLGRVSGQELGPRWSTTEPHPVLDGVDPLALDITRAVRYDAANARPIAASGQGTPLLSVIDAAGRRGVVLAFSLAESNLAAVPAFPVLVGNAIDWLARPAVGEARAPGPVELEGGTTRVVAPDGQAVPLQRAGSRVFAWLIHPGFYLVETGGARSVIAVNAGAPDLSDLMRTNLSDEERRAGLALGLAGYPWWTYGVMLAFVLLVAEWWTWQRRVTV